MEGDKGCVVVRVFISRSWLPRRWMAPADIPGRGAMSRASRADEPEEGGNDNGPYLWMLLCHRWQSGSCW